MKNIITICLAFFTLTSLSAQDAKSLLDEVSKKVRTYENIKIDFKYSLNNTKENVKQDTRGDVTLQGDKYLLNMLGTTRLFDGAHMVNIVPEDEEVTISKYDSTDDREITPAKLLTWYE
mgnify:CR=1 FL=1